MREIASNKDFDDAASPAEIRAGLEHLLSSTSFKNSKRQPRFLRFVVEKTLLGHSDEIKERLLGIEVFDRDPLYDLATDPIVRVAAGDIRKRLAQYYGDEGKTATVRFSLPAGAYVPAFLVEKQRPADRFDAETTPAVATPLHSSQPASSSAELHRRRIRQALLLLTAFLAGVGMALLPNLSSGVQKLWKPLLAGDDVPVICVGDLNSVMNQSFSTYLEPDPQLNRLIVTHNHVGQNDVASLARISAALGGFGKQFRVILADDATLTDLRNHPAVLIGAFDNQWTRRLLSSSRFQLHKDQTTQIGVIFDSKNPGRADMAINFTQPMSAIKKDYGLITRMTNTLTGQPTLILAGVGPYGTAAASEFVTNRQYFNQFLAQAPRSWQKRDIQIVVSTDVVEGRSGPPTMLLFDIR